jgi:DNA-binding LacI/PurR family transcriptional regulator
MGRSRVTIRDVAARAGVSRQTISRVINGSASVSSETEANVKAAIAALGYQPNAIARIMARGRTHTIACLSPNLTDYTFASVIEGAEAAVRGEGYFLMSSSAPTPDAFRELLNVLVSSARTEGLMVFNPFADERHRFMPPDVPTVLVGARPRMGIASSVAQDDVEAGRIATAHLLALGHRHVATVTGPLAEDCTQDRLAGYYQMLLQSRIAYDPDMVVQGDWSAKSGYEALLKLRTSPVMPTAIFAQNDQMAVGILRAARDSGLEVPVQLSVMGVDDIPLAAHFEPPLTTVRQDFAAMGREAARLMIRCMEDPAAEPEHVRLRRSTYPAPAAV